MADLDPRRLLPGCSGTEYTPRSPLAPASIACRSVGCRNSASLPGSQGAVLGPTPCCSRI